MTTTKHISCHWFRKDLRLHDNPSLSEAIVSSDEFYAIYILSPLLQKSIVSESKKNFLFQSLKQLDDNLRKLNNRLIVVQGNLFHMFPLLIKHLGLTKLTFESTSDRYGRQNEKIIEYLAQQYGVQVSSSPPNALFHLDDVIRECDEHLPTIFEEYLDIITKLKPPESEHPKLTNAPAFNADKIFHESIDSKIFDLTKVSMSGPHLVGGEDNAIVKLNEYLEQQIKHRFTLCEESETLDSTKGCIDPYIGFGCLSSRAVYYALKNAYQSTMDSTVTTPYPMIFSSLLWREFFLLLASQNDNFDAKPNNNMCLQWEWSENIEKLNRWKQGNTGIPFIDAIMRQLKQEGWISKKASEMVCRFLTTRGLWVNWQEGFKVFDALLLESQWSLVAGTWMLLSESAFFQKSLRLGFCSVKEGKRLDPNAEYIKKYVPEVKNLPLQYIFEPWKTPISLQRSANCIIGTDYQRPIVDLEKHSTIFKTKIHHLEKPNHTTRKPQKGINSIHWFRKDLRLHDNPSLLESTKNCSNFYGIYVLDVEACRRSKISANKWNFLRECLQDLDKELRSMGSRLFVVRGRAMQVLPRLIQEWSVTRLTFEIDNEPAGRHRDAAVQSMISKFGVEVISHNSHLLYDTEDIKVAGDGSIPFELEAFLQCANTIGRPKAPDHPVDRYTFRACSSTNHLSWNFDVPALTEFGVKDESAAPARRIWKGGETEALKRINVVLKTAVEKDFSRDHLSIDDFLPSETHLSPYLRFGCLSVRMLYHRLACTYLRVRRKVPPLSLFLNLYKREHFLQMGSENASLHKVYNNAMCLQLPWEVHPYALFRWKQGTTGFPWIDAIMRQLRQEGWINNAAREAVGCFLTRGCLWINWEEGFNVFDEMQLDSEWGMNANCWMWLSCSTYIKGSVPWICPVEMGKKLDFEGRYTRRYVPEVRHLPNQYVHEPWKAPHSTQREARCVVGIDYPEPMCDHMKQRQICVQKLKDHSRQLIANGHITLHWFRKDLRLHDNTSLLHALRDSKVFYGVYFLDPVLLSHCHNVSPPRVTFLIQCLEDLDKRLKAIGSRLFVIKGRAVQKLKDLFVEWGITRLSFEFDSDPHSRAKDSVICEVAKRYDIQVISEVSHTLFDGLEIAEVNKGHFPSTYSSFEKLVDELPIKQPVNTVDVNILGKCVTPIRPDHELVCGAHEKGKRKILSSFKGGETEGLRRLKTFLSKMVRSKFDSNPIKIESFLASDQALSPYLRFGCLSPRLIYQQLTVEYLKLYKGKPPVSIYRRLLQREFLLHCSSDNTELHHMKNNTMSLQLPWEIDDIALQRWKKGNTGFPWIDAIMRQLRQEGWIHNAAREVVGCFLTRGCLWINWEEGFKFFDEMQLDSEWGMNANCWMWLSCSSYINGTVPWSCPVEVGKKLDASGIYVRKYVPEVRHLPMEYLFEPWKAPLEVQHKAKCIIGTTYPQPLCDHIEQRNICVQRLKDFTEVIVGIDNSSSKDSLSKQL